MPTPTLFSIAIEPLLLKEASAIFAQAGLTPEQAILMLLERTAREGAIPLKKSRARHRAAPQVQSGLFKQTNLFDGLYDEPASPRASAQSPASSTSGEVESLSPTSLSSLLARDAQRLAKQQLDEEEDDESHGAWDADAVLIPNLSTLSALQDAQARLCWRARQREETTREEVPIFFRDANGPKLLIESKLFYKDKAQISRAPNMAAIVKALEALFDQITVGQVPAGARPLYGNESVFWAPLGEAFPRLGIIYEAHEDDVCLIRYGLMSELFG